MKAVAYFPAYMREVFGMKCDSNDVTSINGVVNILKRDKLVYEPVLKRQQTSYGI
jgi:hypothetical protein